MKRHKLLFLLSANFSLTNCANSQDPAEDTLNFSELAGDTTKHYPAIDPFVIHHKDSEGVNGLAEKLSELRDSNYYYISTVDCATTLT